MSPTDQQSAADATASADAEVPAEHEVPEALVLAAEFDPATREQWRELVAGVLRKAGRDDLPDPVEDALAVTVATGVTVEPLYTAEDAGDLAATVGVPGLAPFVRGARAGRASDERRARRLGRPSAARPPRRPPSPRRRSPPTWRTASPRCGWCSVRARSRSTPWVTCSPTSSWTSRR